MLQTGSTLKRLGGCTADTSRQTLHSGRHDARDELVALQSTLEPSIVLVEL